MNSPPIFIIRKAASAVLDLAPAYLIEMIILYRLYDLPAVADTDGKTRIVFQNAAVILKIQDMIRIYEDSFIDKDKTGVFLGMLHKFRNCHTGAENCAVRKSDIEVMGVRHNGSNIAKKEWDCAPTVRKFDIFCRCWQNFYCILQNTCNTLR